MSYEDLRKILDKECRFATDVEFFWNKYEKELKELSISDYNKIQQRAAIIMECDYMCV